jgi:putative tryptophan/tyrosine transport system substrate-binding protein
VARNADVIVVTSTEAALAAKHTTGAIPIVMANIGDPVSTGLVASLAHPGGNVTGISFQGTELAGKQARSAQGGVSLAVQGRRAGEPR